MSPDAAESWPHPELIESFHGRFDFEAPPSPPETPADAEADDRFRTVLGRFASGVTVIAAQTAEGPVGMTCQSFSSVSLRPPLILFAPTKSSRAWARIRRAGHFSVNILAAGQEAVSNQFASRAADKYADMSWTPSAHHGDPHLEGAVGYLDCAVHSVHEEGDHYLVVGRVLDLEEGTATEPLLFFRSNYRELD
ncbi:flavin reductase family protein [Nocardioides sp. NPDC059952]|uniref:flavin reductase family protein n=1 Tax=Nocardioides sp. NPDC059952 TaxID=3347014 RepID=UPI00365D53D7